MAGPGNPTVEIYVRLLHEGSPCSRPARAVVLGDGLFELLPAEKYDPRDEDWEFLPGATVRGQEIRDADRSYLLAVSP